MDWLTKQKTYVWLIIILVVINLTTLILLWIDRPDNKQPFERGPKGLDNFLKAELGLNDEQDRLMKELRDNFFASSRKIMDEMDILKKQVKVEAFKQNPDKILIDSIAVKVGSLQSQIELMAFKHFNELSSILNPEQSKKFLEIFEKNRRSPHTHSGERPTGPPPSNNPPPK